MADILIPLLRNVNFATHMVDGGISRIGGTLGNPSTKIMIS
jgi:hypothetical protein